MLRAMGRVAERGASRAPDLVALLALLCLVGLLLFLVGRPVATDDIWWHLALGERYAAQGPYLDADPLLHTAERPPSPAAWLFDVSVFGIERAFGFQGLRAFHVALVLTTLALAYSLFRRESGSKGLACLATGLMICVAWYRFMQLRPGLLTALGVLLLYRLVLEKQPASWRRVLAAAALMGVWANLHAAFLVGPLLLFAALLGLAIRQAMVCWARGGAGVDLETAPVGPKYALPIAAALALGLLASLLNPQGVGQHLKFLMPTPSPELTRVTDDWMPFDPFAFGDLRTRLGPLVWWIVDALLVLVPAAALWRGVQFLRRPSAGTLRTADPVLFGLAAAALVAMVSAVRFQWLIALPLLFLLRAWGLQPAVARPAAPRLRWVGALTCLALVPAFGFCSGYSPKLFGVPADVSRYLDPAYSTGKYHAHAVWVLRDAGLEGRLWNEYFLGGFLGYWLTPRIQAFVNGTLNYPPEAGDDFGAIKQQRGARSGESFLDVLDRRGVNLFFGVGLPSARDPSLPPLYSTPLLERAEGWKQVFRDLRTAVYLRDDAANRENMRRVQAYYAREGVPFDSERGFDPLQVVREEPVWAVEHGLIPHDFGAIATSANASNRRLRGRALERLAGLYGILGAHEEQIETSEKLLRLRPRSKSARRWLVHGLLLLDRTDEAERYARELVQLDPQDARSRAFANTVQRYRERSESAATSEQSATSRPAPEALAHALPVLTQAEAVSLLSGAQQPLARRK
jgi:tetratricopeptide (TPR) repeat protein